jgi:acyl carrier protein
MTLTTQKVRETLAQLARKPVEKIVDELPLNDLVADSFALVEIVIELQEELGVRLVRDHLQNVKTVGEFTRVVVERAAAQAQAK